VNIEVLNTHVAVRDDTENAVFESLDVLTVTTPAPTAISGSMRRATVELYRRVGALPQRGLLGGVLLPNESEISEVIVCTAGPIATDPVASCQGSFGRSLAPGLPFEFGQAVVDGLLQFG
jgi:hypothetical protein